MGTHEETSAKNWSDLSPDEEKDDQLTSTEEGSLWGGKRGFNPAIQIPPEGEKIAPKNQKEPIMKRWSHRELEGTITAFQVP